MAFIITVITGAAVGFIYDFFRVIINNGSRRKLKYTLSDIFFWIIAGAVMLSAFYYSDNMNVRLYQFLGIFTGFGVYFLFLSFFLIKIHVGIYKIFHFFFKILFTIVKFFVIIIVRIFKLVSYPFVKMQKISVKFIKIIKDKTNINLKLMRKV